MQTVAYGTYSRASSNTGYFFADESTIRSIATAMGASVHIGSGTGNISGHNSYTASIAGTPFVEVGNYYFTIMQKTSNSYLYMCLYNKSYSLIVSDSISSGSTTYVVGYSDKYNIKYITTNGSADKFIFCEYENINGVITPCVVKNDTASSIYIYHNSSSYNLINLPTCASTSTTNYICIQEMAFNFKLAVFKGVYVSVVQYAAGHKTIQLNGETYDVLNSGSTNTPAICIKMS